ncbi:MAG TPA: HTH-type transcriptional activator IlvY [Polyangiaceae bacterium]|nr:HTH-type transcriptional activator IlvY [Polyangiaceae bacterium]
MAASTQEELSLFLHLAESLHFARSAKAAGMSPSALTRSIQRLEEELGQPLFQRNRRSVSLTRAGEIFRDHARAQLAGHARLLEALAAEKQAPTGELRIACTVTACHSVLPKLFARCRARYPGIHLQLSTSDAARCLQGLENDEADLAVVPEPDRPAGELRFVRLAYTELAFIAPVADAELSRRAKLGAPHWDGLPVILPRRGLERERIDAWLEEQAARPDVYAEVDGNEAILALVALGCGVGVVPELVRKDSPLRGRIEPVEVRHPPRGYHVSLCAKTRTLSRRTVGALWELAPASASA